MAPSRGLPDLLRGNQKWAAEQTATDAGFFSRLAAQQQPAYLWIGCSDSRVPANQIVGLAPGEIFVHRNIANQVIHSDLNCLSVIQFAVDNLAVRDIIVCGHYGCAGVGAALQGERHGLVDNWLRHLQDIAWEHREALQRSAENQRPRLLSELNVMTQVFNVARTTIVEDAWARKQPLAVHGLIYGVDDGLLRDLEVTVTCAAETSSKVTAAVIRIAGASRG